MLDLNLKRISNSLFPTRDEEKAVLARLAKIHLKQMGIEAEVLHSDKNVPFPFMVQPKANCFIDSNLSEGVVGGALLGGAGKTVPEAWADLGQKIEDAAKEGKVIIVTDPTLKNSDGSVQDGYAKLYQFDTQGTPRLTHEITSQGKYLPVSQVVEISSQEDLAQQVKHLFGGGPHQN